MLIIHTTLGFGGGVGTVIKNLINYQIKQGYNVGIAYLIQSDKQSEEYFKDINGEILKLPIKRIKLKGVNLILGIPIKKLYKNLKKQFPNKKIVFHSHNLASVGLLNSIKHIPLLCTVHGINSQASGISQVIIKKILTKLKKNKCKIVGVSNQTTIFYNEQIGENYITTVLNGVKISPVPNEYEFTKFTVGYLAFLDDFKGWRILFDAYTMLDDCYKEKMNLIFAGSGSEEQINQLEDLIRNNHLTANVHYLGLVNNAGNTLTPNLDLVVLPSKSEGIPMTLLEALGNSVPVLATKVGGIPEVIDNGVNGFFIERNPKDIAEKLCKIFDDKVLYEKMKIHARKTYEEKFTTEIMGMKYSDLYNILGENNE
jgi:glycosyltransferase involved in cell wall biosynthesis